MTEAAIMRQIQLAMTKLGHRVFRNSVGVATTDTGYVIRFGLAVGSSDLIGWTSDGKFLAIEVKRPGKKTTQAQRDFIEAVRKAGGIAMVACSAEEAVAGLSRPC